MLLVFKIVFSVSVISQIESIRVGWQVEWKVGAGEEPKAG